MTQKDRAFFQQGVNEYVPAMAYACAPIHAAPGYFDLGTPATASGTALATLINAQTPVGTAVYLTTPVVIDATYGRTITVTPSGVPGNANVLDVFGYDYLMQPMAERFTGSAAASTALVGVKAFKVVLGIKIVTGATNAITVSIGTNTFLGLPYKGLITHAKEGTTIMSNAQIVTNTTAPVLTDPQTPTTGDPRGLYNPTTAPNGVLRYYLWITGDSWVNAAGNGGLHGIKHLPLQ